MEHGDSVLLDRDAGQAVVRVVEDPDLRRLDPEVDGMPVGELPDVGRDQGDPLLPLVDVLSADADTWCSL